MPKIRLTKNELKKQKEILKRLNRYLPTLELKKQQLIIEIRSIRKNIETISGQIKQAEKEITEWVDVFAEEIDIFNILSVKEIKTTTGNIAGINIPIFQDVLFEENPYDLFLTPLWVDKALEVSKNQIILKANIKTLKKQMEILREELRITVQRINLFEKVKIPESKENIRVIQIYLGDLQTAEVVRGKIAKNKIQKKKELAVT